MDSMAQYMETTSHPPKYNGHETGQSVPDEFSGTTINAFIE
jgi:hypothetical protein